MSRSSEDFNDDETFLLDWNNHNFSLTSSFADIRDRQDFIDVTIVAGPNDAATDEANGDADFDDGVDIEYKAFYCSANKMQMKMFYF